MSIRDIFKLILILLLIAAAVLVFNRVETVQSREETGIVRDAVRQAAVTCYAVEGAYPDSIEYLRDHYQLAYDEERYAVTLDGFASNLIPDIYIEDRYADNYGSFLPTDDVVTDEELEEELDDTFEEEGDA